MLRYLKIANLAIIDNVEIEFGDGFNVLTGETGAGKSILIGALNLLLGSRGSAELIRTGEEEAHVEGLFEISSTSLPDDVQEAIGSGEFVLSRKIARSGRSRCWINGNLASVGMLQTIGSSLVSIFGQHDHRVLLDPDEHIDILDRYGALDKQVEEVADLYSRWKKSEKDLDAALKHLEELKRESRENADSIKELSDAGLKNGEEEALTQERDTLKKAVQIREKAFEAYQVLYGKSGSILENLSDVKRATDYLASTSQKFETLRENLQDAVYRLDDVALELRDIAKNFSADPARLEAIEERLVALKRLKRKYGRDIPGLIAYLDSLSQEEGNLLEARNLVNKTRAAATQLHEDYLDAGEKLSISRKEAASKLEKAMAQELSELAMREAVFSVEFQALERDRSSQKGLESVEFFLASNPGEAARPLARIASGGELSRIMLALKALQADGQGASTVIFDEVDAGIGGNTAFAVGSRLARVARRQQVLCVTHLHQIAALANHHFAVQKHVNEGRTQIDVKSLDSEARPAELARMLGAGYDPESVKEHIKKLMELRSMENSQ
jgi:DNA repair protein RecN (Recombination protein N)